MWCLNAISQQAITWANADPDLANADPDLANADPDLCCYMVSPDHND